MLKRTVLAIFLTLIPLFTAVSTVKAATYYSILDIFRYITMLKPPEIPTENTSYLTATPTLLVTITLTPSPSPTITPTPEPTASPTPSLIPPPPTKVLSESDIAKTYIMQEINSYRSSQGLNEVKTDPYSCDFAEIRAREIAENFNHEGFTNRINSKTLPYPTFSKVTENIALNSNYQKVVEGWKKSPGHAENMRADTPFVCVEKIGNYYVYVGWKP